MALFFQSLTLSQNLLIFITLGNPKPGTVLVMCYLEAKETL
jgi:hypothetical protein